MLGVHSLAPAKLYIGTATVKKTPTIRRVVSGENGILPPAKEEPAAIIRPSKGVPQDTSLSNPQTAMAETRDAPTHLLPAAETESALADNPDKPRGDQRLDNEQSAAGVSEPQTAQHPSPAADLLEAAMMAGPSRQLSQTPHSPSAPNTFDQGTDWTTPEETRTNAILYRRDPETVIAYLVSLPQPIVQGKSLAVPPKYFLYAPPPPHLVKPAHGNEGYAVRLTRHWQQNVRKAKMNAHNGKKVSWRGTHSKMIRSCVWGLNKLKYDDVAFLARIHPKTVTHLILIHPSKLSAMQTPEEILSTFRAQIFESKKRAKRNSIISAALFLPALAIDTAAVFFGGLAEIDGIWMLMGPDPKTMEISQEKLIEDAQKLHPHPEKQESDEESETGAIRRSVDALRRGVGSIKHRISQKGGRNRRKSESGDRASTDTSRPQTRASQGFVGRELEDHAEEAPAESVGDSSDVGVTGSAADSNETGGELSGMLEHSVEEEVTPATPARPGGGIFQDDTAREAMSTESGESPAINKGQNFQLTFDPSPAMDILDRYMQESCRLRNGQAFTGGTVPPTEGEVLTVMGWHPERRQHQTVEQQQEDEEWQAREIEDDLRLVAAKAAKSWDKACRKEAKRSRRPMTSVSTARIGFGKGGRLPRPQMLKGKTKQNSPEMSDADLTKQSKATGLKQKLRTISKKPRRNHSNGAQNNHSRDGKGGLAAALLCIPGIGASRHAKHEQSRQEDEDNGQEEKRRTTLKDRLAARKAGKAKRGGLQPDSQLSTGTAAVAGAPAVDTLGETEEEETTHSAEQKQSRAGTLGALVAAIRNLPKASKRKLPKQKDMSPAESEKPTKAKKVIAFSALKKRVKSLRTKVMKIRSKMNIRARLRKLKQKRVIRTKTTPEEAQMPDREVNGLKTHSAMVGLVAGCLALPGAKVKELREKRRANRASPEGEHAATVPTPEISAQPTMAASESPLAAHGGHTNQPPVPIPEEDEGDEVALPQPPMAQYLPGHGQSEIPVTSDRGPRPESNANLPQVAEPQTSVEQAPPPPKPSSAAATRFNSFRDGMSNFTTRTRQGASGHASAEGTNGNEESAPNTPLATSGGRFAFRHFRAKGRAVQEDGEQGLQENFIAGNERATGGCEDAATPRTKTQAVRDGFGNISFKRKWESGGEASVAKDKKYKDRSPGFIERMRWIWYMS